MALHVRNLKKALPLLCISLLLIALGREGQIGQAKSRLGWGHGVREQSKSFPRAIRPWPRKTKISFMLYGNTPFALTHIRMQEIRNILNFIQNFYLPGGSSGGVPL